MKIKSTLHKMLSLAFVLFITAELSSAQPFCNASFTNGCFSWRNQAISLDAINWTIGVTDCSLFDNTGDTAFLTAGTPYPMTVTDGDWCGCGVWIDFDHSEDFDTTENVFHLYTANQTNIYNFNITIPVTVPSGVYRMRVIAGWGTDCYTVSGNGYGACGTYSYGNFNDFMISVSNLTTGIAISSAADLIFIEATPNPAFANVTVTVRDFKNSDARLQLTDATGRIIEARSVTKEKEVFDIAAISKGIYFLNYSDGSHVQTLKLIK